MPATRTRRDLVTEALAVLGVLGAGQAAEVEDFDEVDGHVDGLLSRLAKRNVLYVGDVEAIDAGVFDPLAVCLADAVKEKFGNPAINIAAAEDLLRQIRQSGPTYERARPEYF